MARITSQPQSFPQGLFSEDTVQNADFGAKASTSDGRVFRYVKAGAQNLIPGQLFDGPATVANHTNIAVAAAAAVGATQVTVTLGATAATANQYANGYLIINDVDGEGHTYGIKSNPAANASTSLVITLNDDESIQEALTTSSQVTLVANQYNGVIVHAATETGVPVGVAIKPITAGSFGWIQTRGPVSVLADASPAAIGQQVDASTTTDGATTLGTAVTAGIGYALAQQVATEYNPVFLNID